MDSLLEYGNGANFTISQRRAYGNANRNSYYLNPLHTACIKDNYD